MRTLTACAAAGALAWLVTAGAQAGTPAGKGAAPVEAAADEAPGYAVEDFDYPQADKILAEEGITLKRGDGHIVLADCGSQSGLLEIYSRSTDKVCFRVTGTSGRLTLEIPAVFGVKGNDYATEVDMTTGDEQKSFDVDPNTFTAVGESADDEGRDFMLVEISSSK
ncbi:hypothetical protein ABZ883_01490 [Streptomyces sp. NPDC046977]|uniref:hypothetical protein n=1 Tax=Streptomyces sp. NPDC046977 TaxID=3154703 RepID=UPI00340F34B0